MTRTTEFLQALSEALECETLKPDDEGRVYFGLDNNMGCVIFTGGKEADEEDPPYLIAAIYVGVPNTSDTALLIDMLQDNYMWVGSGYGTIAIEPTSGALVLHREISLSWEAEEFVDAFAHLAGAARHYRERLESTKENVSATDSMMAV